MNITEELKENANTDFQLFTFFFFFSNRLLKGEKGVIWMKVLEKYLE